MESADDVFVRYVSKTRCLTEETNDVELSIQKHTIHNLDHCVQRSNIYSICNLVHLKNDRMPYTLINIALRSSFAFALCSGNLLLRSLLTSRRSAAYEGNFTALTSPLAC